ncbi:hypothetical protein Nepgr_010331 [Nepenthes gracilis]|uniref:Uncharacterized protein n=1 Tax=Nepenthes gracilis TaxID=150966 RepID=A0AAD3XLA1_NEPGR|nr:hypothetical protein Nepgr_010331 [Nepenthes gracilis]
MSSIAAAVSPNLKKSIPFLYSSSAVQTTTANLSRPFSFSYSHRLASRRNGPIAYGPSENPGKSPPEFPSRPNGDSILPPVPPEVPEISTIPEVDPTSPDEVIHTRTEEIGTPRPRPDPRPNPEPDFPGPPIPSPPGPDTVPPPTSPDVVPPPPDGLPPPPEELPPRLPEIVPPPSTPPPAIDPPTGPRVVF